MKIKIPGLPQLLKRKIYKTGQTRGADDDVIYQNRVGRNSTVLIPYQFWNGNFVYPEGENSFENGHIVLIPPKVYFEENKINETLKKVFLKLGENCLVFYEIRQDWDRYNPIKIGWKAAQNRRAPLGGNFVARVPATTAKTGGEKIIEGFTTTASKGAGIRLYEYASKVKINKCRLQLEAIYWLCHDSTEVSILNGMTEEGSKIRKAAILRDSERLGLLDFEKLRKARTINKERKTICPLCLEQLSGKGFFNRMAQAEGREVPDLTVTEVNLFHINELRYGVFNHKPYNIGWGHHHCNVVTKDSGIKDTLKWMQGVLRRNEESGLEI